MGERKGTKALELWCRRMTEGYPGVKIENMTTSWRDGLAFCAMIHHFRPDLIDFDKLNKEDVYYNNDLAFRTAERHLGIPALLDAVDMASYEVPDRLSILTYLAQFYQVFAAQDASNRLNNKRTANVVEKNSITKSTGPPPKMAHVVGVPKREPCQKCSMPVFLAERLTVGKKVYHRTCLKCARCGTQLTPGSFYETEIDGEYCCETCPDEEKTLSPRRGDNAIASTSNIGSGNSNIASNNSCSNSSSSRFSSKIADRLAFFENVRRDDDVDNSNKRLLQKSLSDEEKSQSLKKIEGNHQKNVYQMNTAFNSFLSDHYAADVTDSGGGSKSIDILRRDSAVSTTTTGSSSSSDEDTADDDPFEDGNDEDIPPELPKTLPPSSTTAITTTTTVLNNNDNDNNGADDISGKQHPINLTNASLKSSETENKINIENDLDTPSNATLNKNLADDKLTVDDDDHDNEQKIETEEQISVTHNNNNNSNDDLKNSVNVAKDSSEDLIDDNDIDDKMMRTNQVPDDIDSNNITNKEQNDNNEMKKISIEADNRSSASNMVRARLHQFENIANNKISSENTTSSIDNKNSCSNINNSSGSNSSSSNNNNSNSNDNNSIRINSNASFKNDDDDDEENVKLMSINDTKVKDEKHENEVPKKIVVHLLNDDKINVQKKEITVTEDDENASCHNRNNSAIKMDEIEKTEMDQENEENESNKEISMGIMDEAIQEDDNHNAKEIKEQIILSEEESKHEDKKNEDVDEKQHHYLNASNTNHDDNVDLINATAQQNTDHTVVNDDDYMNTDDNILDSIQDKNKENTSNNGSIYRKNFISIPSSSLGKSATLKYKSTLSPDDKLKNKSYTMRPAISTSKLDEYPEELDPFKSENEENDDEHETEQNANGVNFKKTKRKSLNPFDDESDDNEENPDSEKMKNNKNQEKLKPPRPPPPKKISTNPFGSESEDEEESMNPDSNRDVDNDDDNDDDASQSNSVSNSSGTPSKRTPVPTPRNHLLQKSQNPTPEPTPRVTRQSYGSPLHNFGDYYGSQQSLSPINAGTKINGEQFIRAESCRGSSQSLTSSSSGTGTKRKTKKAPAPPPPMAVKAAKELFPTPAETDSKKSSPSSSNAASPKPRKKRPAPAPPSLTPKAEPIQSSTFQKSITPTTNLEQFEDSEKSTKSANTDAKLAQLEKLSDEEKVLLESSTASITTQSSADQPSIDDSSITTSFKSGSGAKTKLRLIALDASLIEDSNSSQDLKLKEEDNVVYRRKIMPSGLDTPIKESNGTIFVPSDTECEESHDRQLEKLKDNKEAKNRNRQSHISLNADDTDPLLNKSVQGKWKRRKGPAPALPVPPRKVLQMLPLQEIRHELEVIEVQQQGLEKQGVMLEKMIRDRCEGQNAEDNSGVNSKEVEDLILQLFELVNEKNELFRRQAELMYLRRQHRLEQEQADLEYEIRVLMAQPERNKTDSDKAREESLIARLIEVVQLRNEVIECLEMDRLREAEEDMVSAEKSIKQRLEMHTAKRDEELSKQTPTKLSKKEKKKQKELKKLVKSKKLDADKDADESELNAEKQKTKKKKKKFLF